jgi:hypothetical protein
LKLESVLISALDINLPMKKVASKFDDRTGHTANRALRDAFFLSMVGRLCGLMRERDHERSPIVTVPAVVANWRVTLLTKLDCSAIQW